MNKELFWRVVFHLSLGGLALWVILKSLGVFNTPFWLEYGVPVGLFIIAVLALYHNFFESIHKIFDSLGFKMNNIEKDVVILKTKVSILEKKI